MKLKALALIAAVLMTASCFAACGKTEEEKPVESNQEATNEEGRSTEHQQIQITSTPITDLDYMDTDLDFYLRQLCS